jgi:hypothetical protein
MKAYANRSFCDQKRKGDFLDRKAFRTLLLTWLQYFTLRYLFTWTLGELAIICRITRYKASIGTSLDVERAEIHDWTRRKRTTVCRVSCDSASIDAREFVIGTVCTCI